MNGIVMAVQVEIYNGQFKPAKRLGPNEFVIINNAVWKLIDAKFVNDPAKLGNDIQVVFELMTEPQSGHSVSVLRQTVDPMTEYQTLDVRVK